jgi:hypothetical protein
MATDQLTGMLLKLIQSNVAAQGAPIAAVNPAMAGMAGSNVAAQGLMGSGKLEALMAALQGAKPAGANIPRMGMDLGGAGAAIPAGANIPRMGMDLGGAGAAAAGGEGVKGILQNLKGGGISNAMKALGPILILAMLAGEAASGYQTGADIDVAREGIAGMKEGIDPEAMVAQAMLPAATSRAENMNAALMRMIMGGGAAMPVEGEEIIGG